MWLYRGMAALPGWLLQVFFAVAHDPTRLNRQGPDEARSIARLPFKPLTSRSKWPRPTSSNWKKRMPSSPRSVAQGARLTGFDPAEKYH